jgi:signal transduction histidine kinase
MDGLWSDEMRRLILKTRGQNRPFLFDSLLALALSTLVLLDLRYWLQAYAVAEPLQNIAGGLLQTAPVAWRRRAPLTVLVIVASAVALREPLGLVGTNYGLLSVGVCTYTVAAYGDRRRAALGALAAAASLLTFWISGPEPVVVSLALVAGAWLLGRAAGRGWELKAREAVGEERLRIARELHDVVAHSLTVIAVQGGAARMSFDANPEHARQALGFIESKSRQAMAEMRRLLGILHPDEDKAPGLSPQPGLGGLDSLIDEFQRAGLEVKLTTRGDPRPLPAGLELSAYRIVQESLTNVLKHAGPTRAQVCFHYRQEALEVAVLNEAAPSDFSSRGRGGGYGLVGMRERAELFGGDLHFGPRPEGGFEVRARLPLEPTGTGP